MSGLVCVWSVRGVGGVSTNPFVAMSPVSMMKYVCCVKMYVASLHCVLLWSEYHVQ